MQARDSSLKKYTAFNKKLRSLSEESRASILQELPKLNLSKCARVPAKRLYARRQGANAWRAATCAAATISHARVACERRRARGGASGIETGRPRTILCARRKEE
eukprot:2807083-Pleurochrysis_carterae.AAC.1